MTEARFDVVVYEIATGRVDHLAGVSMLRETGFYNAEKRRETASARLNERYAAAIFPAGRYFPGDIIPQVAP